MARQPDESPTLVEIPVVDAPDGPLHLARLQSLQLPRILRLTHESISPALLRWGDVYAARCLRSAGNPYLAEIDEIARLLAQPGAHALNFSFEMGCTTACRAPDGEAAMQLYRALDWPFRLGGDVVVARHATQAGPYYNITWPGYLGVLTAMAPRRFAAAINQPPMSYTFDRFGLGLPIDWLVNRWRIRRMTALPPVHLLRQAFEQCTSYAQAKEILATTPICIPVIYTLTGTTSDEGCIIERREHDAVLHEGPVCVANHWQCKVQWQSAARTQQRRPAGRDARLDAGARAAAVRLADATGAQPLHPRRGGTGCRDRAPDGAGLAWGRAADTGA
jgi:hypothetical protein